MTSVTFVSQKPANPCVGDVYMDPNTFYGYIWDGYKWQTFSSNSSVDYYQKNIVPPPTEEQLEKYPALKQAWEEYVVIIKLLGLDNPGKTA